MTDDELITSALRRFAKLGGLVGRVGVSVLTDQALGLARSAERREDRQRENLVRNAARIVETLGELKGAAMKVGQMLSLQDGLLPREVAEILRALQKETRPVPPEVIDLEIRSTLENYDDIFESLEPEAFAAASIGQVHRGVLRDGRQVAVKIKYPLIDEIVTADLANLKTVLKALFTLVMDGDFDPIWKEVRDRLLEELDYRHEAQNIRSMADLHAGIPDIVVPEIVDRACSRNVLTMEYLDGIPPDEACSGRWSQQLRDRWGVVLVEFLLRGLLEHRMLHADPNLANFSFREDGSVVVYDYGCVKKVPASVAAGYADLILAAVEDRKHEIPMILHRMGLCKAGGAPLPLELTDPWVAIFDPILAESPPYVFGEDDRFFSNLMDLKLRTWSYTTDVRFPEDLLFISRTFAGHFGNLSSLRAIGPWRDLAIEYAGKAIRRM
jgi:predicted unusual protein kinase regulating ubiquinone biosynthesis (AarF/ABC1/UbiB family)